MTEALDLSDDEMTRVVAPEPEAEMGGPIGDSREIAASREM